MSKARGFREKPLPIILLAGFIGIVLTVLGGLIAQERNIDQYAARQVDHQIDWITNHPEPYDPAGETSLADWVANKVGRTGLDRTDMVFAVNSAGEDVTKLGSGVPELAQSGLLQDADARSKILTPGEGRVGSASGDFYYRTVNFNVGSETVTLSSLVYLGGLEKVQEQTRNSMILLGLGGFLILAIVAASFLAGKRVVDADRSPHGDAARARRADDYDNYRGRDDDGPRRKSAMSTMPPRYERDDLADRSRMNNDDYSRDRSERPSYEPKSDLAPTARHDVARHDVDDVPRVDDRDSRDADVRDDDWGAGFPDDNKDHKAESKEPSEVRASGVWSWAEEDDKKERPDR